MASSRCDAWGLSHSSETIRLHDMDRRAERREWLAREFEEQRPYLRTVAYRMLGSMSEADDALQESWLRLDRNDARIEDFRAWLTNRPEGPRPSAPEESPS